MDLMLWLMMISYSIGGIAQYVLCGIGFGSLMRKRKIKHWGIAWVPLLNTSYAIGRLSDHISADYQQRTHRALYLLLLQLAGTGGSIALTVWAAPELTNLAESAWTQGSSLSMLSLAQQVSSSAMTLLVPLLFCVMAFSFLELVLLCLCLFNIYREYAPRQATLYIIIFLMVKVFFSSGLMAPIFVLMIRNYPSQFSVLNSKKAF